MDPGYAQQTHPGAYSSSGAPPPSASPDRSHDVPYTQPPEDIDAALRYTPLASVVPISGGTSFALKSADIVPSLERIAGAAVFLLLSDSIDDESGSTTKGTGIL